jgi:hypothetical protein
VSRWDPWLYYVFLVMASALLWLRPALVYLYDALYGPAQSDPYLRVNGIYFPLLWLICVVCIASLAQSVAHVVGEGGIKHWFFLALSGILVAYLSLYLLVFRGSVPSGLLG